MCLFIQYRYNSNIVRQPNVVPGRRHATLLSVTVANLSAVALEEQGAAPSGAPGVGLGGLYVCRVLHAQLFRSS